MVQVKDNAIYEDILQKISHYLEHANKNTSLKDIRSNISARIDLATSMRD